jgi:hypothetical protein
MFHHTFTIQIWARITADGDFFSISKDTTGVAGEEDVLRFAIDTGKLTVFFARGTETIINYLDNGSRMSYEDWHHVSACFDWSEEGDPIGTLGLYGNGE